MNAEDREDLEEVIDITNKASELTIYEEIYTVGRASVVCALGKVVNEEHWNKLLENVKNKILQDLDEYIWEGGCETCLELIRILKMERFFATEMLMVCYSYLGKHINLNHIDKSSFIKFLTEEKRFNGSELMDLKNLIHLIDLGGSLWVWHK